MALHNTLGKHGEELAEFFLKEKGFEILHKNWRHSYYEIDIIAKRKNVIHFVEVKYRSSKAFANPEESVNKKKLKFLMKAADEFLSKHQEYKHIQFDVLSINQQVNQNPEFFFIQDVYLY